jgi:hypothetical protein
VIVEPIPKFVGQYVTFEDTLPADDTTEALVITRPNGTLTNVAHGQLTRVVNTGADPDYPAGTITYSYVQQLDQAGAWIGQFSSSGAAANATAPMQVYVV